MSHVLIVCPYENFLYKPIPLQSIGLRLYLYNLDFYLRTGVTEIMMEFKKFEVKPCIDRPTSYLRRLFFLSSICHDHLLGHFSNFLRRLKFRHFLWFQLEPRNPQPFKIIRIFTLLFTKEPLQTEFFNSKVPSP